MIHGQRQPAAAPPGAGLLLGSTVRPGAGRRRLTAALLFLVSLGLFAVLTPQALPNGDAAVYAQQIARGDLSERTVHLGYLLLGSLLEVLTPLPGDRGLNLLNAGLGAGTVALAYLLTLVLDRRQAAGVAAALLAASHYLVVANSVFAEVYAAQAFFLLLALWLWMRAHPVAAGAGLAASALVSPSAVFALPAFAVLRPAWRPLLRLALAAAALLALALAPVLGDYLFGGRGLLHAAGAPLRPGAALLKEGFEVTAGFSATLPLVAVGVLELARRPRLRPVGLAIASLWAVSFLLGERFGDVPVQLPTYVLLCVAGGLGLARVEEEVAAADRIRSTAWIGGLTVAALAPVAALAAAQPRVEQLAALPPAAPALWALALVLAGAGAAVLGRRRSVRLLAAALLLVNGSLALLLVRAEARAHESYRATVLAAGAAARSGHLAVGEWSRGILYEHYLYGRAYTGRWIDPDRLRGTWGEEAEREARRRWEEALAAGREVWLLSPEPALASRLEQSGYRLEPFGEIQRATREGP